MKRLLCLVLCAVVLFSLCACDTKKSVTDEQFALDTFITFNITAESEHRAQQVIADLKNEINSLEGILSATEEGSDVYNVNNRLYNSEDFKRVVVNDCTSDLIRRACDISKSVDGAFDISVYPLVKLWGFDSKDYRVPSDSEIADTLKYVGYQNISVNSDNTVELKDNMSIDLGAIAKGYIGERIYELMKNSLISKGIVNLGGMVVTCNNIDSDKWSIGVEHPGSGEVFMSFDTNERYVVTSGAYQRYFEQDGEVYHHILDTKTGKPSNSDISSVTVVGADGVMGDALSTAFYVMGVDKTIEYIRENTYTVDDTFNVIILSSDMKDLYITADLAHSGYEIYKQYKDINVHIIDV